ncbi:hypothetical protein ABZT43_50830, partial [Streptomyces sp. NPDC005349]|uniref:hypothetical protein n=1 Tax=Streptomyces sp. NPDC005349 TaxID=3157037 RepID=UPI0033A0F9E5
GRRARRARRRPSGRRAHGRSAPGLDQVIGQGDRPPATWPRVWGKAEGQEVPAMVQAVTMKGGEYYFMPSLSFLRGL